MSAVTTPDSFLIGTDHSVTVSGVKDEAGTLVTGATFTGTLYDRKGTAIASGLTFTETAAGTYKATLVNSVALRENEIYNLVGVAVKAGVQLTLRIRRRADYVQG